MVVDFYSFQGGVADGRMEMGVMLAEDVRFFTPHIFRFPSMLVGVRPGWSENNDHPLIKMRYKKWVPLPTVPAGDLDNPWPDWNVGEGIVAPVWRGENMRQWSRWNNNRETKASAWYKTLLVLSGDFGNNWLGKYAKELESIEASRRNGESIEDFDMSFGLPLF